MEKTQELIYLIQLTHPKTIEDIRRLDPEAAEYERGLLLSTILLDDAFNGYSESDLETAINEATQPEF